MQVASGVETEQTTAIDLHPCRLFSAFKVLTNQRHTRR